MQTSPALSSNERDYWERDKYHYENKINNDEYIDGSINLIKLQKDQHYSILPKKFNKVYDNLYYDNFTNEDDYYEDNHDSDDYYEDNSDSDNSLSEMFVPFKDLNKYFLIKNNKNSKNLLTTQEITNIIDNIKLRIKHNRFKLISFKLTIKDIEPFYKFINLNDELLYQNLNHFKVGIYINKDHSDVERRKKVIDFAFMYFAFDLYCYNYDYIYNVTYDSLINQPLNGEINDRMRNEITRVFRYSHYNIVYDYYNKDLSFLDYTISLDTDDKILQQSIKDGFVSHYFGILKLADNKFPFITLKVPYRKITQEEINLLENYPIEAAFIYKNYPYLQNICVNEINIDPFFNMLRILKKAHYRLNIESISSS